MEELMDIDELDDVHSKSKTDFEDGELSNSDEEGKHPNSFDYKNNAGGFTTGFNVFDQEEDQKRLERAKRFALENDTLPTVSKEVLVKLYETLGMDSDTVAQYRLNSIHIRGTEEMSTADVFEYFSSFAAASIEWINDVSCNVVWLDDVSAARAMLSLSKEIRNLDKVQGTGNPFKDETKDQENTESLDSTPNDTINATELKIAIPPGFWRSGTPHAKAKNILMRFAMRSDKKQINAQRNSDYYKKYGNPHYGNMKGIISESMKSRFTKRPNVKSKGKSDLDKKNPWGDLAEKWADDDDEKETPVVRNKLDLRESLTRKVGVKSKSNTLFSYESADVENDEWTNKSKKPRMKMHADDEEKKIEKRLETERIRDRRKALERVNPSRTTSNRSNVTDLRNLISSNKKTKQKYTLVETSRGVWTKVVTEDSDGDSQSDSESSDDSSDSSSTSSSSSSSSSSNEERETADWALEEYKDLRQTLQSKNRKPRPGFVDSIVQPKLENPSDSEDDLDNISLGSHRSPLQIEIDNDDYIKSEDDYK